MPGTDVIKSTAQLTPDGLAGYAKAITSFAQLLGLALAVLVPYLSPGTTWSAWVGGAVVVLGFIGTIAVPNAVKPVVVVADPVTGVVLPPDHI